MIIGKKYDEVMAYVMENVAEDIVLRNMNRVLASAYAKQTYPMYPEVIMADWARFQGMTDEDIFEYEKARAFNRLTKAA